jgi:hypothetical protein
MIKTNTLAVVETATGLASVAIIQKNNFNFFIVEKQIQQTITWENYYDGLHLHTSNETMEKTCCISADFISSPTSILLEIGTEPKGIAYLIFKHKKA